jgi:hypothetical protein
VAVPMKISDIPASVRSDIMAEKMKTNTRTTQDIQPLLIGVNRNRITGMKSTETAKKTTISLASIFMRPVAKK